MDVIHTTEFESPIGLLRIASSDVGLAHVQLSHASGRGFDGWRSRHAPDATVRAGYEPNQVYVAQILEFLDGKREVFEFALDVRGTPFQIAVYEEVARIPFGHVRSYAEVAAAVEQCDRVVRLARARKRAANSRKDRHAGKAQIDHVRSGERDTARAVR